jgi:pyruvate/2-oxoglutarate dehydrogenase complex dihydrolipoamide dehydrogenase (E3) component
MAREQYDAVVIGAGQAGVPLAVALARAGRRTALVERVHIGGTCVNEGCTPTKTMVASARTASVARRAPSFGVGVGTTSVDMVGVRARKERIVDAFREGSTGRLADAGVDVLFGDGRFETARTVHVVMSGGEERSLLTDTAIINVGARPSRPAIPGLEEVPTFDSTSIMALGEVPEHLVVLGGSYVGLEFAQMFRRFGSEVTVIQRSGQLLSREDADVAAAVADILREDGIDIRLDCAIEHVERADGGRVAVACRAGGEARRVCGTHVLVALGRIPNTEGLGLEAAGVVTDKGGFVRVSDTLATSAPGIYAAGDVKGGPSFTHIAYDDFRVLRARLIDGEARRTTDRLVPYTVFIDPQLGRIGLSESEARAAGREVRVATMPMGAVARAIEMNEMRGFLKVVVDSETDRILGVAVLGVEGGELMGALQIAMMGGVTASTLRDAVFAHPTLIESFNNLFDL